MVLTEDYFASLWSPARSSVPEVFEVASPPGVSSRLFPVPLSSDPSVWCYDPILGWVQGQVLVAARDDLLPLSGLDTAASGLLGHCILVTTDAHSHGPLKVDIARSMEKFLSRVSKVLFAHYR